MALYYNLSKVYAISDNDVEFAKQIVHLFIEEVPAEMKNIKSGLKEKDHQKVYQVILQEIKTNCDTYLLPNFQYPYNSLILM